MTDEENSIVIHFQKHHQVEKLKFLQQYIGMSADLLKLNCLESESKL